ncbi:hypothetical protein BpHYR1_039736 [Brachionus plicatilis]|uniref:Uncharacterized protein n=1 Tax=Brachionus plicatilis TaxID=10195 RepID=A0A3M7T6J4_BRAPC|nr:hypothetical protein BpHYR1_039736 [Brachionus plicatilis]
MTTSHVLELVCKIIESSIFSFMLFNIYSKAKWHSILPGYNKQDQFVSGISNRILNFVSDGK